METHQLRNFTQCQGDPIAANWNVLVDTMKWLGQNMCMPFVGCYGQLLPDFYNCREHVFLDNSIDLWYWFVGATICAFLIASIFTFGKVEPRWLVVYGCIAAMRLKVPGISPVSRTPSDWPSFLFYVFLESGAHFVLGLGLLLPRKNK